MVSRAYLHRLQTDLVQEAFWTRQTVNNCECMLVSTAVSDKHGLRLITNIPVIQEWGRLEKLFSTTSCPIGCLVPQHLSRTACCNAGTGKPTQMFRHASPVNANWQFTTTWLGYHVGLGIQWSGWCEACSMRQDEKDEELLIMFVTSIFSIP